MFSEKISQTAIETSGWTWTIFEHVLAIGYILLFIGLISKWLKFKNKDVKLALYISLISVILSFFMEVLFPIKLALLGLPTIFIVAAVLIRYFYREKWKKSFLSAIILIGLIIAVNILLGISLAILKIFS